MVALAADDGQFLLFGPAHRESPAGPHPPAGHQQRRDARRAGRHDDHVVGRVLGPAAAAVERFDA